MDPVRRNWIRSTLWVGLALAAVWLWVQAGRRVTLRPADGAPVASAIELRLSDGTPFALDRARGHVVLLNLWASWCAPCRAEMPLLARIHRELGPRGLLSVGINVEGLEPAALERVRADWSIPFPVGVPLAELGHGTFAAEGVIPHTWLVDRQGRVRASHAGLVSERSLRRAVVRLLEE